MKLRGKGIIIGLLIGTVSAISRIHRDIENGIERTVSGWSGVVLLHILGFVFFFLVLIILSEFMDKRRKGSS